MNIEMAKCSKLECRSKACGNKKFIFTWSAKEYVGNNKTWKEVHENQMPKFFLQSAQDPRVKVRQVPVGIKN